MKSYRQYLLEADYTRFLKKNRFLTKDKIELINTFFKRDKDAAKAFDKKFGWQSDFPQRIYWAEWEEMMGKSKTGRKINLNSIKIKGSKGKDYWPIRLKTKGFIANIPLNYETAKYMNSCDYGSLDVNYCIGWNRNNTHWVTHTSNNKKVPVYIVDGERKWVVMILPDNKSYEVWDKFNKEDGSNSKSEPIPGFSIKKELIGGKMSKMYDGIREEFYTLSHWIDDASIANADYKIMYGDILWQEGKWRNGIWEGGIWKDGTWYDGIWKGGNWKGGTWWNGEWKGGRWTDGRWKNGDWYNGTWKDGLWENGKWLGGTWEKGTWKDGTWYNGTWLGGYDNQGNYHEEGDSPDKW